MLRQKFPNTLLNEMKNVGFWQMDQRKIAPVNRAKLGVFYKTNGEIIGSGKRIRPIPQIMIRNQGQKKPSKHCARTANPKNQMKTIFLFIILRPLCVIGYGAQF